MLLLLFGGERQLQAQRVGGENGHLALPDRKWLEKAQFYLITLNQHREKCVWLEPGK